MSRRTMRDPQLLGDRSSFSIVIAMSLRIGGKAQRTVHALAETQRGYFTAAQARAAGVSAITLGAMKRRGNIDHISAGVYRIGGFVESVWDRYVAATLWPETRRDGVRGTISHASALSLYEIGGIKSAKTHITVPRAIRIRREAPSSLIIHRADLRPIDARIVHGVPVTSPERTIWDCLMARLGDPVLRRAIADAERLGLMTPRLAARVRADVLD